MVKIGESIVQTKDGDDEFKLESHKSLNIFYICANETLKSTMIH